MADFAPAPNVRDVNATFVKFLNLRVARHRDGETFEKSDEFESFAQKWGLDNDAMDRLLALPTLTQASQPLLRS